MAERSSRGWSPKPNAAASQPTSRDKSVSSHTHGRLDREPERRVQPALVTSPVVAADEVAQMAMFLRAEAEAKGATVRCDACEAEIEGEPGGSGLYLWTRGTDDVRIEEPPLCEACATAIGTTQLRKWDEEDEEEG